MTAKPITKAALLAQIAEASGVPATKVGAVLDGLFAVVSAELTAGRPVNVPGIGKIALRPRAAGVSRNPATGAVQERPADQVAKITLAKPLKDLAKR